MKRIYLLVLLFLAFSLEISAQFYNQYFDGADTIPSSTLGIQLDTSSQNVWQIGKPQKTIFSSAATIPNAIVTDTINPYPINNTSIFVAKIPKQGLSTFAVFALQWKQKLDLDSATDGGIIESSLDGGITWVNAFTDPSGKNFYGYDTANAVVLANGQHAFSGLDTLWRDIWLCYPIGWLNALTADTLLFRFTLSSDSVNNNKEGWLIDNFMARSTVVHTIKNAEYKNYINVFPNPAKDVIRVELQSVIGYHMIEKMELIDEFGKVVDTWQNLPTSYKIATDKYAEGIYYLKVRTNLKTETVPISIRKP
ncbi:MAG: hypothetical protein RL660_716 [Bacteroidota bacterium]|jgi:hypothetical protein